MADTLHWIRLECLPLPGSDVAPCVVYWNPDEQQIIGEAAEQILHWVSEAKEKGYISTPTLSHFEIVNPLTQPSELAAILGQYYWVVPEPVSAPEEEGETDMTTASKLLH